METAKEQYDRMVEECDKALMERLKKEYPNMPENIEEVCYNCRQMGKGCDEFPCNNCYASWK